MRRIICSEVRHERQCSQRGAISLRAAPRVGEWRAIDAELGLAEAGEVAEGAGGVGRVLQAVGERGVGFEKGDELGGEVAGGVGGVEGY